ncbi:MAG: hypothetical protein AAGB31_12195 [Bdellovibrio sp.]
MNVKINTKDAISKMDRKVNKKIKKVKSECANLMNREVTASRRKIVETLISQTGLKRKVLNDRLSISRANPKNELKVTITPLFGKKIYMMQYPWTRKVLKGGKAIIRLLSPLYKKDMKTAFLSKDKTRMFLRPTAKAVEAVKGRTIPRLFKEGKIKEKFQTDLMESIRKAIKDAFK